MSRLLGLSNKEALSSRRGDCCSRAHTTSEGGGVVGGSLEDCRNAIVFGETLSDGNSIHHGGNCKL